ncbi:SPOR domain-containing protein [Dankookia rubra]|uniref:SPOR domain-containing protein n=1 Tax=Dankookia rubra TaxID=1442381 RepID=A0A4V3AAP5_9PROT|nr:SPOR domain-containing protein [Dankookia rubra]TDH64255.1 SPOR domain-containing protein [Dankookia rubra]
MSDLAVPSWRPRQEKQGLSVKMLAVAGGLVGAVALAGAVAWGLSRMGPQPVPVIEADVRPLKVRPENPGGMVVPNQDQLILEPLAVRREAERRSSNSRLDQGPEAPQLDLLKRQAAPPPPTLAEPAAPAPAAPTPAPTPAPPTALANNAAPLAPPVAAQRPAPAAPAAAAVNGRAMIQLGALATEEAARAEWDRVAKRVPELAGFQPRITKVERDGQTPLFRLRAGGLADAAAAKTLCEAVRAKGGACVPVGG